MGWPTDIAVLQVKAVSNHRSGRDCRSRRCGVHAAIADATDHWNV